MNLLKPPQAVIYTQDMEPITTISMKPAWWDFLYKCGHIRFAVYHPDSLTILRYLDSPSPIKNETMTVDIIANIIRTPRSEFLLLTTTTETEALLLEPVFQPGQIRKINEEKRNAFVEGFAKAFLRYGSI